jgi:cellulose biosynthesis protein BcsQ
MVSSSSESFNPELCRNESEVESKFIVQYLLPKLGYKQNNWHQEVALGNIRLDFLAFAAQNIPFLFSSGSPFSVVIEAKSPRHDLDKYVTQIENYVKSLRASYGLLTNGKEIRIYQRIENSNAIKLVFLCFGNEIDNRVDEIRQIIGRDYVSSQQSQSLDTRSKEHGNMKIIAVYHNKGGVGKTTTVVNLAAAFSRRGLKTLVIDLDSQANTTYAAGLMKFHDALDDDIKEMYVYHVLLERNKYPISEVVRQSSFTTPSFDVIPSHINLMKEEKDLTELSQTTFTRLVNKLEEVKEQYDVVLIDTPPSLNLYAKVALIATDYLIIPSDLKPFANEGLINVKSFVESIDEFREMIRKEPIKVLGVLPSKINTSPRFVEYVLPGMEEVVQKRYGFSLLKSRIFERRDVSAAIEQTVPVGDLDVPDPQSIFDYKPDSKSTMEFRNLADEIQRSIGL